MRWFRRTVVLAAAALAVAAPLLAIPEPAPRERERNRRELDKVKSHPQEYARLRHELRDLLKSPPDFQERLWRLDRALYDEARRLLLQG